MEISELPAKNDEMLIELTADVVAAYVSNNPVPAGELPNLISDVHMALSKVGALPEQAPVDKQKPAVNPKRSVHEDYIICLEDGKKFKSLKRHLMHPLQSHAGSSTARSGALTRRLPDGCPQLRGGTRSKLAKDNGLGRKRKTAR
jgi:predicted transcriptional regulator